MADLRAEEGRDGGGELDVRKSGVVNVHDEKLKLRKMKR